MIFYRYVGRPHYVGDEDHSYLSGADIRLEEYESVKETSKGYWIKRKGHYPFEKSRFVLRDSRRRFAYPEKHKAWESFKLRAQWRIAHLDRQMEGAKAVLEKIQFQEQFHPEQASPESK